MVRVGVLVVALLMSLSGCAEDSPYGEFGPSSSAPTPEARFDAEDEAYLTEDADGGALLSQAIFGFPDTDQTWASVPGVGVTEVAPGEVVEVEVRSALPLTWFHPFGTDLGTGPMSIPRDVDEVRFCLGVVAPPFPESMTPRTEEDGTRTVGHASAAQHLFCSDSAAVG